MHKRLVVSIAVGAAFAAGGALAAPPDWSKVPAKTITVFYPGVSPMEWIMKGTEHGGARAIRKGETCASCHDGEAADMGKKIVTGQKIEPNPQKGKAGSIPVQVQASNDGTNLYLRFSWKQPAGGGGAKMHAENPVKLASMLGDNKVEGANIGGCWSTCHEDSRTMPGAKDDKKTKYVTGGALAGGKFFDLVQWKAKGKPIDGHVADASPLMFRNLGGAPVLGDPVGVMANHASYRWVVKRETGTYPAATANFVTSSCNHCASPACMAACPLSNPNDPTNENNAIFKRASDGVVLINDSVCNGRKQCIVACPYGAPQFNSLTKKVEKCTFCVHRLYRNGVRTLLEPACVTTCVGNVLRFVENFNAADSGLNAPDGFGSPALTKPAVKFVAPRPIGMCHLPQAYQYLRAIDWAAHAD